MKLSYHLGSVACVMMQEVDAVQDASMFGLASAIRARAVSNVYANRTNQLWYTHNDLPVSSLPEGFDVFEHSPVLIAS